MKKIFLSLIVLLAFCSTVFATEQWMEGTGEHTILGSENGSDIDSAAYNNIVSPLNNLLAIYREGLKLEYSAASELTVGAGACVTSNSDGSIRLFGRNAASTTIDWDNLDTGSEATSTTYYVYGYHAAVSDKTLSFKISASSTTPSGITYYRRLGSFYNDASGNISNDDSLTNDNNYYALQLGDWVSKSDSVTYQATTDGFVTAYATSGPSGSTVDGYTDSSNPPTTQRAHCAGGSSSAGTTLGITMPVKKGDYWKVTGTHVVNWIPSDNF